MTDELERELDNDLNELRDKLANDFFDGDKRQADGAIIEMLIQTLTQQRLNKEVELCERS